MTFYSSQIGRAPQGLDKLLAEGRPQRNNPFDLWVSCGVLSPHPCRLPLGNFCTMVMWHQRERGTRVSAPL